MREVILNIEPWGNGIGVRLPEAVRRAARLSAHQQVRIAVENGRIIISPLPGKLPTLDVRLALFDPAVHGGEALAIAPTGLEAE